MTNRQKRLVQDSFSRIAPAADAAASLFLTRLRELDPQFRHVAPGDVAEQAHKLMGIVAMTVKGLDRFEELVPELEQFGSRYESYRLIDDRYESVEKAMAWTLGTLLGPAFNCDVREAWYAAYHLVCSVMRNGSREEELAAIA
jgi:hemoglobin-like flavoprotein